MLGIILRNKISENFWTIYCLKRARACASDRPTKHEQWQYLEGLPSKSTPSSDRDPLHSLVCRNVDLTQNHQVINLLSKISILHTKFTCFYVKYPLNFEGILGVNASEKLKMAYVVEWRAGRGHGRLKCIVLSLEITFQRFWNPVVMTCGQWWSVMVSDYTWTNQAETHATKGNENRAICIQDCQLYCLHCSLCLRRQQWQARPNRTSQQAQESGGQRQVTARHASTKTHAPTNPREGRLGVKTRGLDLKLPHCQPCLTAKVANSMSLSWRILHRSLENLWRSLRFQWHVYPCAATVTPPSD